MSSSPRAIEDLPAAVRATYPELASVAAAAEGAPVYLVGGAVRDLLLDRGRADIDLVVVGSAAGLAAAVGVKVADNERFGTAKTRLDGHEIDIATARTETYPAPGALPVVEPAAGIEADLARRDFTVNAMAIALDGGSGLIDPHGGREDLDARVLRVLHPRSFVDDPTRALRAARYGARYGLRPDAETEALLRATDLGTVSADRRRAELARLAVEPTAVAGLGLLAEWGLVEPRPGGLELAAAVDRVLGDPLWAGLVERAPVLLAAALGPEGRESALAAAGPERPSQGVELAAPASATELVLARALGAEWVESYVREWSGVDLEIAGEDLIAAGIPQGPALGRGLGAAKRMKLDGEVRGREAELAVALAAAREHDEVA